MTDHRRSIDRDDNASRASSHFSKVDRPFLLIPPHELVGARPPECLSLATLFVGHFAILSTGQRAQVWLETGPDPRPQSSNGERSRAGAQATTVVEFDLICLINE